MTKFLSFLSIVLVVLMVLSCDTDDSTETPDPKDPVQETIMVLTNNSEKSWQIDKALLLNTQNTSSIDISDAFNIKDDVFVFSTTVADNPELLTINGSVVWKQREGVNWEALTLPEIFKDFYEREMKVGFEILEDDPNVFKAFPGLFDFTIIDENTITGKIRVSENAALEITLTPLLDADVPGIPTLLSFKEVATLELNPEGTNTTIGLTGSNQSNALYIGRRGAIASGICDNSYRFDEIVTYNLTSNTYDTKSFCQGSGLSTKEVEVIDGKLIVVASDSNNIYDLNLNSDPSVAQHDEFLTRYGTATLESDIYITGSKFDTTVEGTVIDQLFRFNVQTNVFEVFETLPVPKVWADVEIVDDKLYIFGGQDNFSDNDLGSNDILIYDFNSKEWKTLAMSKSVNDTFTGKYHNLIFVGGNISVDNDGDGGIDVYENFLGVLNTRNNSFSEISFETPSGEIFRQLTVLNDKIYLVTSKSLNEYTFKLYEAELK